MEDVLLKPGILLDPLDSRDAVAGAFIEDQVLPSEYIGWLIPKPLAQGYLGYCGSFTGQRLAMDREHTETGQVVELSPRFCYAVSHKVLPGGFTGYGMYTREVMQVLCDYGIPEFSDFPYDVSKGEAGNTTKPSPDVFQKALKRKGKNYARVTATSESIKQAIYSQGAVALSLYLSSGGWSYLRKDIRKPAPNESLSGHLISAHGWNSQGLIIQDSLITERDGHNYSILPWDYQPFFMDCWTYLDLPNDWQTKNTNYKEENMVTRNNTRAVVDSLYRIVLGRNPESEDVLNGHADYLAEALNTGSAAHVDEFYKGFVDEIARKYGSVSAEKLEAVRKLILS